MDTATGLILLALGLTFVRRQPGVLLLTAGVFWFLGDVVPWAALLHRGPLVHLVLAYPFLRPRTYSVWAVVVAGYLSALPPLTASESATLAVAAALPLVALHARATVSGAQRRARTAAVGAAAVLAVALSLGIVLRLAGVADSDGLERVYDLLVIFTAGGLCADLRWGRWTRGAVTDLVVSLAQSGPLRDRLARALDDPTLLVGFWLPAERRYVDEAGRGVDTTGDLLAQASRGRATTMLEVDGERVGVLIHDAAVLSDPALVADVAAAARLAMANIGLRVEVRTRAAEAVESRRRLVESADVARRELSDDLRNGPGRRLDRVADLLRGAATGRDFDRSPPGSASEALGDLMARLDRTTAVLRDLVAGVHPPALAAGGLAAGLPELVRLMPVPVILSVPSERFPGAVESAAYFVCAEALANVARHANASCAWITAGAQDGRLRIEIEDDGAGGPGVATAAEARACEGWLIVSPRSAARSPSTARPALAPG